MSRNKTGGRENVIPPSSLASLTPKKLQSVNGTTKPAANSALQRHTPSKKLPTTPSRQDKYHQPALNPEDFSNGDDEEAEFYIDSDEFQSDTEPSPSNHRTRPLHHSSHNQPTQPNRATASRPTLSSSYGRNPTAPRTTLSSRPTLTSNPRTTLSRHPAQRDQSGSVYEERDGEFSDEESEEVKQDRLAVEKYLNDRPLLRQLLDEHRQLQANVSKLSLENGMLKDSLANKDRTMEQQKQINEQYQATHSKDIQQYCDQIAALQRAVQTQTDTALQHEATTKTLQSELAVVRADLLATQAPHSRRKSTRKSLASDFAIVSMTEELDSIKTQFAAVTQDNEALKHKVRMLQLELTSQQTNDDGGNTGLLEKYQTLLKEKRELQAQITALQAEASQPSTKTTAKTRGGAKAPTTSRVTRSHKGRLSDDESDNNGEEGEESFDQIRTQLTQKEDEIAAMKKSHAKLTSDHTGLQEKYKKLDIDCKQLIQDYDDLEAECNDIADELASIRAAHTTLQSTHNAECKERKLAFEALQQSHQQLNTNHTSLKQSFDALESEKSKLQADFNAQTKQLTQTTSTHAAAMTKLTTETRTLQQSLEDCRGSKLESETRLIALDNQYQSALRYQDELLHKVELLEDDLREKDEELTQISKNTQKEIQSLKERLEKSQLECTSMIGDDNLAQSKLKRRITELECELEHASEELHALEKSAEEAQNVIQHDLDCKDDELRELTRKYKKLQQMHSQLKDEQLTIQDSKQLILDYEDKLNQKQFQHEDDLKSAQQHNDQRYELLSEDYNTLKGKYDTLADQLDSLQSSYNIDIDSLSHQLQTMRGQCEDKGSSYNALILRFTDLERNYEIIKQENEVIEKQRKQYLTSINETQNTIATLNKEIATLQAHTVYQNEAIEDYKVKLDEANEEMVQANEFVKHLEERYEKSKKIALDLRDKYRALKNEHALLSTRYTNAQADNNDLQQQIQQLVLVKGGSKASMLNSNISITGNTQQFNTTTASNYPSIVPSSVIKQPQRRQDPQLQQLQQQQQQQQQPQPKTQLQQSRDYGEADISFASSSRHQSTAISSTYNTATTASSSSNNDSNVVGLADDSVITRTRTTTRTRGAFGSQNFK